MWYVEESLEMTHKLPQGKLFLVTNDLTQIGPLSQLLFDPFIKVKKPAVGLWAKLKLES